MVHLQMDWHGRTPKDAESIRIWHFLTLGINTIALGNNESRAELPLVEAQMSKDQLEIGEVEFEQLWTLLETRCK